MFLIGIDVAKDKHDCCVLNTDDGELTSFTFANSRQGFEDFLERSRELCGEQKTKVGLESTGHYSANLLAFLEQNGFQATVFNPLSVSRQRLAGSLRRTKTDKNDSRYIAQMLTTEDKPHQQTSYHIATLKSLTRARFRLSKEIQPIKNRFRRLIHMLFPELQGFFCKLDSPTALNLLQKLPSAKDIASCNIQTLTNILVESSHGRHKRDKAVELKALAKSSIGTYNAGDAFELKLTAQRICFIDAQKAQFDQQIDVIMAEIGSPITSIPGIGNTLGAVILAEIGDRHFETPAKLLAFAGAEPSLYQSGKYTATRTPMVKHGSRYLRCALFLATRAARLHSPTFAAYIAGKKAQGKHEYVALSHGMKKLVRVIFAVLTQNRPYQEPV